MGETLVIQERSTTHDQCTVLLHSTFVYLSMNTWETIAKFMRSLRVLLKYTTVLIGYRSVFFLL
jgi:hypothetical protein